MIFTEFHNMLTVLHRLSSFFTRKEDLNQQRLEKILNVAEKIAKNNPDALRYLVRLLGRKLQSDYMCRAVSVLDESKIENIEPKLVWFDEFVPLNQKNECLFDLKKKTGNSRTICLASDIVLPCPWNIERVVNCISYIGAGKSAGIWCQDTNNHIVEYWLPFGISWVRQGNHSIMTGIIQGQGTIVTDDVYDISDAFRLVRFDGHAFIRVSDNTVISSTSEIEFAAIFEVGRIMHKYKISA